MRTLLLAFCLVGMFAVPAAAQLTSGEQQKGLDAVKVTEDERLQRYKEIWEAQRPKLNSGIIHYKQYSGTDFKIREHDKVRSLFQEVSKDREDYPEIIRDFACKLSGVDVPPVAPEYPELVLYFKGGKIRYERYGGVEIFNDNTVITARQLRGRPAMQITIGIPKGGVKPQMNGLYELYYLPSPEVADTFRVVPHNVGGERLKDR